MTTMTAKPSSCSLKRDVAADKQSPPSIPKKELAEFVGDVPHLFKIDQHHLWNNRYRVNVWTQHWHDDSYCPTHHIVKSFYLLYEDRKIIDKTIKKRIYVADK